MADLEDQKQVQDAEREIVRLWRAWRTVKEMCQDRVGANPISTRLAELIKSCKGYEMAEEEVRISLEDFRRQCVDPIGGLE